MYHVIPIPAFKDNYIWLVRSQSHHYCIVVDPGDATPVIQYLQQARLFPCAILITHHHHDHSGGIGELQHHYPEIPVYGPTDEAIPGVTNPVDSTTSVAIPQLPLDLKIIDIPGHTLGHIAYYGDEMLFCGDTLFAAGCGRIFEGTPAIMLASLHKLLALPGTTQLFCGHEYTLSNLEFAKTVEPENPTIQQRYRQVQSLRQQALPTLPSTLALEKQTNPFLRVHTPAVKQAAQSYTGQALRTEVEVFAALREWKNNFS